MIDAGRAADMVLAAEERKTQIAPLTDSDPGFDLVRAGVVAVEVMGRRVARGEPVAGHKLGFTNKTIWDEYGVHAPIWGPVYETTVAPLGLNFDVGGLIEPRIEPEIVFRLSRAPAPDMEPDDLIACVSHLALGFELVQSIYPGWKFRPADTVAAFALHGALRHGPFVEIVPDDRQAWVRRLARFPLSLFRNGDIADVGESSNVLGGGPVTALAHLAAVIATIPGAPGIEPGQVFTTGTLTRALPVAPGELWEARAGGLPLDPIRLALI